MNSLLFKIKKNFVASLIFLVIVVSCGLAVYYFHPSSPYHKRYTFVVKYETIGTLSPGNLVRVRGIAMGEIVDVKLTDEAVYVSARVLAEAKIPVNSEFRLVTAGLMGEREMSIITGNSSKLVADGDTVSGLYDEGTSGISKNLAEVFKDIGDIKQTITDFCDSITVGETGKRLDRVGKKVKKLLRVTNADIRKWKSMVDELLDGYQAAGENLERSLQELSDRGGETATKANEAMDRVRALLDRVEASKNEALAIVTKFDESEGSARMFLDGSSKLNKDFDVLKKDFDTLLSGVKKDGLKLNVDIF
ncbi:phospholipid/cholesterol/gamma-HCH transport system substrate-binding protein [Fibrobacter succinogenes subsp. elongatus]|uniref:Phospholipid/cholesterol/gamma-HCH transport system substrate-binding protein n=1 Tax=Fibrobacter succinogenes TaxID=833 RepID=A0A380S6I3_FIBSU|nr:phospholipid/cholesterol/gamma-HCH transport system substrate-binding protein [Fibrobacter succinogenes subsp. elongatus]SUQ24430.1 phospholipid/cholesterol/gamma-HCH transport system substrate-binding protein [Fibrobacter succinogenes]